MSTLLKRTNVKNPIFILKMCILFQMFANWSITKLKRETGSCAYFAYSFGSLYPVSTFLPRYLTFMSSTHASMKLPVTMLGLCLHRLYKEELWMADVHKCLAFDSVRPLGVGKFPWRRMCFSRGNIKINRVEKRIFVAKKRNEKIKYWINVAIKDENVLHIFFSKSSIVPVWFFKDISKQLFWFVNTFWTYLHLLN